MQVSHLYISRTHIHHHYSAFEARALKLVIADFLLQDGKEWIITGLTKEDRKEEYERG